MIRVPNWDIWLLEWAESMTRRPYIWGETDCGSLVRAAMRGIYGVDAFEHIRPYRTRAQAGRRQRETGGVYGALVGAGWHEVATSLAQQGDVLIHDGDGFPGAGIVVARQVLVTSAARGVQLIAWRLFRHEPGIGPLLRGP